MTLTFTIKANSGNVSQYGNKVFDSLNNTAKAIYIQQKNEYYKKSVLASALPPLPDSKRIHDMNLIELPWYDYRIEIQKTKKEQFEDIAFLTKLRLPLPFEHVLATEVSKAMYASTINRYIVYDKYQNVIQHIAGTDNKVHAASFGYFGGCSGGFLLTGISGTGKSSALSIALSYYPQVIIHQTKEIPVFTQVSYIMAECPPNSNMSGLYSSIARAYDIALKNLDNYHETICEKKRDIDQKEHYIRDLINRYHTLLVIVDEVQNFNFNRSNKSSLYTLMKLMNESKISMCFCGLPQACNGLLHDLALQRRAKTHIDANGYTRNFNYFCALVHRLFEYQWFRPKVDLNTMEPEKKHQLLQSLYQYTGGIIDQLIALYQMMSYEYVRVDSHRKTDIDAEYVKQISDRFFPNILRTLNGALNDAELQENRAKLVQSARSVLGDSIRKEEEKEAAERYAESLMDSGKRKRRLCDKITKHVLSLYSEYDYNDISLIAARVISDESDEDDINVYVRRVIDELHGSMQERPKKRKKKQKIDIDFDSVLDNGYQPLGTGNNNAAAAG